MTLFYAFKQAETTTGRSHRQAGTRCSPACSKLGSPSLDVANANELGQRDVARTNALASSIVLVCRPRPADAPIATRRELVGALRAELPGRAEAAPARQHRSGRPRAGSDRPRNGGLLPLCEGR